MSQHEKIIQMCKDGQYHCQIEFWNLFIRSPHKRRSEIEKDGIYHFETRPCEHGQNKSFDYKLVKNTPTETATLFPVSKPFVYT